MGDLSRVRRLLEAERANLLERVGRVPEAARAKQPAPGRWSVVDVLEHLARVETGVAKLLTVRGKERPAAPADTAGAQLTPERIASVRDRGARIEAPERIRPAGGVSYAEALRKLWEARGAFLAAVDAADPEALDEQVYPHPVLGPLTLRGWVEFVAHHEARHADQVAEIAAAVGNLSDRG